MMSGPLRHSLQIALEEGAAKEIVRIGAADNSDLLTQFLHGVGQLCPFLGRMMKREPARLERVLQADHSTYFAALIPEQGTTDSDIPAAKSALRGIRKEICLAVALADLAGLMSLDQVTESLSRLGDFAISEALRVAALASGQLRGVRFDGDPTADHGLVIIAMGKLGARELNYSSDIDLVAIYDPQESGLSSDSRLDARGLAIKTVQIMVDILSEQTVEGFVFRTDLRLRPNPSSTAVAVSFSAAERYYEAYGQNWERAAFIKSRAMAGNPKVAKQFGEMIRPFVWRRTLDYGALADIHAVKEQIHAQKGRPDLEVSEADIKLGPGGIREIEFFAQTQQLLFGGRDASLRTRRTEEALVALTKSGHVEEETASRLRDAYQYFRTLEHRLQMREDSQTQTLPPQEGLVEIAVLMNLPDLVTFLSVTETHMRFVHDTYADLFDTPEPLEPVPGSLVFTGVDDDPRTLKTLRKIGFEEPEFVTLRIRRWHQGGIRGARSARSRELLTALVPRILMTLGKLPFPDKGFKGLDLLLSHLPGGFQLFSLFTANPEVLDDVLALCQSSPELSKRLGERPALIEGLIEGMEIDPPALPFDGVTDELEVHLDITRREINEHRTRIAAALLLGRARPVGVGKALSQAADAAITDLIKAVRHEAEQKGNAPVGKLGVIGFGRLGIEALTIHSDLDLVFVYEADNADAAQEQAFTRLVRRIVNALSVQTAEGELYTIDMQLRPSGRAGPTAVSYQAFSQYYEKMAWTWELMALTKARIVWADDGFGTKLDDTIASTLLSNRAEQDLRADVIEMRQRLMTDKPPRTPVDVKRLPGGLTDLEFIVQYISLSRAHEIGRLPRHPRHAIQVFKDKNVLAPSIADQLVEAYDFIEAILQYLRVSQGAEPPSILHELYDARLRQLVDGLSDVPVMEQLEAHLSDTRTLFEKIIGPYLPIS